MAKCFSTGSAFVLGAFGKWIIAALFAVASLEAGWAEEGTGAPSRLTFGQIGAILAHGPWPQPWAADPSNRASGNADAVALGRRLFFDANLSPSGRLSCSSCHRPERGWTDGRATGVGLAPGARNTLALFDVRLHRRFGWTGSADSLWAQSIRPLIDPREMGSSAVHIKRHVGTHVDLARAYEQVFARNALAIDAEQTMVDAAKALAAYMETIDSARAAFDDLRDALAAGDEGAAARYPPAARRGLLVFIGKGGCNGCHAGPAFSDGTLREVGVRLAPPPRPIAALLAGRYARSGPFSDAPARGYGGGASHSREGHGGAPHGVRVPSLRNLARTAPYLHDGRATTLTEAIRRHPGIGRGLAESEIADLAAFLETLSE
ncbi:MAG TPA: cytochrome c peroxidase [Hyphomicrobiaceae bacterium]|nr:cytochrome c peroxidase [Hyphomicrobiaceae bacterium]